MERMVHRTKNSKSRRPFNNRLLPCRLTLDVFVGSFFQKLVVACVDDVQIGFVLQRFAQDGNQSITRVGDATTVDDFPRSLWISSLQRESKPCRERSFDGVRPPLNRRPTETEDAEAFVGLLCLEPVRSKEDLSRRRYLVSVDRFVQLEQRHDLIEADERILEIIECGDACEPKDQLECKHTGKTDTHCCQAYKDVARSSLLHAVQSWAQKILPKCEPLTIAVVLPYIIRREVTNMIRQAESFGVLHLRFEGRSCDVPLNDIDVGNMASDEQVKNRLAAYLDVPEQRFQFYVVDRHETGNMTVRPEAVFG